MGTRQSQHARRATLLVASTGGHLEQLWRLRQRFEPAADQVEWATFDDPQARSLLAGERVHYVPYIPPRGYTQLARALPPATRLLRSRRFDRVISTGSAIAAAFLPQARALGIEVHYVESAARADGPSATGKMLSRIPGIRLYSQYPGWADERWSYQGSLFDGYRPGPPREPSAPAGRVVVTFGTIRRYGFRRAVDRLVTVLPEVVAPDAEILWQVGVTDVGELPIDAVASVPTEELTAAIADADLVVAHAGIGSCVTTLDAGRCPVILPRLPQHDEHVDAHQQMIADELDGRGLAVSRSPDGITAADLMLAMGGTVERQDGRHSFALQGALASSS